MIFIKLSQALALIICLLSSSIAQAGGRAGTGGAGGDPVFTALTSVRNSVLAALRKVVNDSQTDKTHTRKVLADYCSQGAHGALSQKTKEICADFIIETAINMLKCAEGSDRVDLWAETPVTPEQKSEYEIPYPTPSGFHSVSAHTQLGCETGNSPYDNDVYFHYERTRSLKFKILFSLFAHELGHKVQFNNSLIDDFTPPMGSESDFTTGHDFLDTVGDALYYYGLLAPSAFDKKIVAEFSSRKYFFACNIFAPDFETKTFSFFVEPGPNEAESDYRASTDREYGFGYEISSLTSKIFPGKKLFIKAQFQERETCEVKKTADFSMVLLMTADPIKDNPLATFWDSENLLCTPGRNFALEYFSMTVDCRYTGKGSF